MIMDVKRSLRLLEIQVAQLRKMITEQKKIDEVLASPYDYTTRISGDAIVSEFSSMSGRYVYKMHLNPTYVNDDIVVVGDIEFADDEGKLKITGKGDAFRIFATVLTITKEVANNEQLIARIIRNMTEKGAEIPKYVGLLLFAADLREPSRFKLYQRLAKNAQGYSLVKIQKGAFVLASDKMPIEKREKAVKTLGRIGSKW